MKKEKITLLKSAVALGLMLSLSTNTYAATIEDKIAGLYVAFFNRAADKSGLEHWENQASLLGEDTAVKTLAADFAEHPKFTFLYSTLADEEYVEAIYINSLGQAGDSEGINYWKGLIDNGMTRSDMVASFISSALDFQRTDPQYASLSDEVLDVAQKRRDLLANKVEVSLEFVNTLAEETNLESTTDAEDPDALDADEAYAASVAMISGITHDSATKDVAKNLIATINSGNGDAIKVINEIIRTNGLITDDFNIIASAINRINVPAMSLIKGTVPGTLIEAFCSDGSYYQVDSVDNNTSLHPFEILIPTDLNCRLVMTTNEDDNESKVITPIGISDINGDGTLFKSTGETIDLGNIPLAMSRDEINDENNDGVSDDIYYLSNAALVRIELENDPMDIDGDGLVNIYEDDDNDGVNNHDDNDDDGDGIPDISDNDHNNDGINDNDYDGDGIKNDVDQDIDNDQLLNTNDDDDDNDGLDDNIDSDDDNDGLEDSIDSDHAHDDANDSSNDDSTGSNDVNDNVNHDSNDSNDDVNHDANDDSNDDVNHDSTDDSNDDVNDSNDDVNHDANDDSNHDSTDDANDDSNDDSNDDVNHDSTDDSNNAL